MSTALRLCLTPCILGLGAALFLATRRFEPSEAREESGGRRALPKRTVLLTCGVLATLGAVTLLLRAHGGPPDYGWTRHPYLDKRWIVCAYCGPIWLERTDLVADDRMIAAFCRHFQEHVERFDAVVSFTPDSPEIEIFKASSPGHSQQVLRGRNLSIYVYLREED